MVERKLRSNEIRYQRSYGLLDYRDQFATFEVAKVSANFLKKIQIIIADKLFKKRNSVDVVSVLMRVLFLHLELTSS